MAVVAGSPLILVVDDEAVVRDIVVRYLQRDGYRTLQAADGLEARALLTRHEQELGLVVLDLMLPHVSGLDLCRELRASSAVPVIMLTARRDEADRIVGLEIGADDYLGKPFSPRELVARVRAVLRRTQAGLDAAVPADPVGFGDIVVHPASRSATRAGEPLRLTAREFDLLLFLAQHPDQAFTREQLLARVWGFADGFDAGTVTVHVRRLREKIEPDPSAPTHLTTVWGTGYLLRP